MMDYAGVNRAVLVPPSWEGDRNDVCLQAAREHPHRFAVMGRLPLDGPTSGSDLNNWTQCPGMLGLRLTFHLPHQVDWILDPSMAYVWEIAECKRIPVMLFAPHTPNAIAVIAQRHPELRLIVDHLGLTGASNAGRLRRRLRPTITLSKYPNIAVKASCLPNLITEDYPFPSIPGVIREVVDAFGKRRVFWGSDVSRLRCSLRSCVKIFTECSLLSDSEKTWIMGNALSRWIGWQNVPSDQP